jgi:sterol desaturase/sphingolipid hydroxylase (fatty acid hydroxylase superfamily)
VTPDVVRARARDLTRVYVPYALLAGGVAIARSPVAAIACFAAGGLAWTLFEYGLHRWVQHRPRMPAWYRAWDDHPGHHADPDHPDGYVFPLPYTLPIVVPPAIGAAWLGPSTLAAHAGFVLAYVAYEWVHFASHFEPLRAGRPWLARWTENHRRHHDVRANAYFGFVTTLWDRVLGTLPAPRCEGEPSE